MTQLDFSHVGLLVAVAFVAIGVVAAVVSLVATARDGYGQVQDRTPR